MLRNTIGLVFLILFGFARYTNALTVLDGNMFFRRPISWLAAFSVAIQRVEIVFALLVMIIGIIEMVGALIYLRYYRAKRVNIIMFVLLALGGFLTFSVMVGFINGAINDIRWVSQTWN